MATASNGELAELNDAEIFRRLRAEFAPEEIQERRAEDGAILRSVRPITIQDRLDEVLYPECWDMDVTIGDRGAVCRLVITLPSGRTVRRAGEAGFIDSFGSPVEAAGSIAFKRAAARLGIGSYLYRDIPDDEEPRQYRDREPGRETILTEAEREAIRRDAGRPTREERDAVRRDSGRGARAYGQAQRDKERREWPSAQPTGGNGRQNGQDRGGRGDRRPGDPNRLPETGRQFFGWVKDMETANGQNGEGLFKHLTRWGKGLGYPWQFQNWSPEEVRDGIDEARNYLNGSAGGY